MRRELGGRAVEGDAGYAGEIGSQDGDLVSGIAGPRAGNHEWGKPHIQAENSAAVICATLAGGSVEIAVGALDQAGDRSGAIRTAEVVKPGLLSFGGDPEDSAAAIQSTTVGSSIEVSVGAFDQRAPGAAAVAVGFAEAEQHGVFAGRVIWNTVPTLS